MTTTLALSRPPIQRPVLAVAVIAAMGLFGYVFGLGIRQAGLLLIGIALGVSLYHASFGFTGAYRRPRELTYLIGLTLLYPILGSRFADVEAATIGIGYLGLFLSGAAFVALGIFVSSLTENQIIAVTVSYGLLLLFWLFGAAESLVPHPYNTVLTELSLFKHMEDFATGVLNTHDLYYYAAFVFMFMFLTLRSLEFIRWKGKA